METFLQDLRYALRGLRRSPGFTLVAMLTLALGIGVNSSVFSVVNAILFRPIPVTRPAELVDIYGHQSTSSALETSSWPNYVSYREQARTLSEVVGFSNFFAHYSQGDDAGMVIGELVTDGYFQVLGIPLQLGRGFTAEEFAAGPGAAPVVVISNRMWQTRFAGASDVLGRTFRLNGTTYTVVGVAPADFGGMRPAVTAQMWLPATMADRVEPMGNQRVSGRSTGDTRFERRGQHWLTLKGRMRPGTTVAAVRAELESIAARLATEFPETNAQERVAVVPSADVRISPDVDRFLAPVGAVLLAAVALVLVVACANLANLLLARAAGRRREIAVRLAIGASRGRLVRQLLTESVLLSVAGGALAIPIAIGFARGVEGIRLPLPVDFGIVLSPDWRVLAFTLGVALVTGILFGLAPAFRATRPDLVPALKDAAATEGRRRRLELRDALVVVQVAVSLVLVVAGALLLRSVFAAGRVELGYDANRIAQVALALEMTGYDAERGGQLFRDARDRLAAIPGVQAASVSSRIPMSLNNNGFRVYIDGRQSSEADRPFTMDGAYVDEHYLDALGLQLLAGRNLELADREATRRVAVVTRTMAERYWPGAPDNAIGREFRLRWGADPYTVVGVVEDYKVDTPGERAKPYLHLPLGTRETYGVFLVRTATAATDVVPRLERELRAVDPDLVFMDKGTLRDVADIRLFPVRAGAWLIGAFGALALAVAAIGLYGVIGYSVSRRVREIGVRKALGAQPRQLVAMVLREGMVLVAIGGVVGAALSAAAAQVLSSALFVSAFDAVSFALAFLVLAIVALTANAVPARRAAAVDPMVAIRHS